MKNASSIPSALIIAIFTLPNAYAGAGADGAAFLKVDAGARASAMGGAITAVADDALSFFYNPAGPAQTDRDQLALAHAEWLEGLRSEHIAFVHPVSNKIVFFTGCTALLSPTLDAYDSGALRTGNFSAMDGAAGMGAAWEGPDNLLLGFFAKAVYQRADKETASAYAGDLGALYDFHNDIRMGLSVQNLGTAIRLYNEGFSLPVIYRVGGAYRLKRTAWLTAEMSKAGKSEVAFASGAEGEWAATARETIFLRVGYKSGRSKNTGSGVSFGLGLRTGGFGVDYAFSPFGDLGDTHRIAVEFRFGKRHRMTTAAHREKRSTSAESGSTKMLQKLPVKSKSSVTRPKSDRGHGVW